MGGVLIARPADRPSVPKPVAIILERPNIVRAENV
jgi:hypothetical protein